MRRLFLEPRYFTMTLRWFKSPLFHRCCHCAFRRTGPLFSVLLVLTLRPFKRASLALLEAAHVGFIIRDPICHLLAREFSGLRQLDALRAHPGGEKRASVALSLPGPALPRRLNFLKLAHLHKLSYETRGDINSMNSPLILSA